MMIDDKEEDRLMEESEQREQINLNYRKSLIEKSRLPKLLAELYYIGFTKKCNWSLTYIDNNGNVVTESDSSPLSKYYTKKDILDFIRATHKIEDKKQIKKWTTKTVFVQKDYFGGGIKDIIDYKKFLATFKKWSTKKGLTVRGDKVIRLLPLDGRNKPLNNVCLWDFEDCIDYLIYKTTTVGIFQHRWGDYVGHREKARQIWNARKLLLKIKFMEQDDEEYCDKVVSKKFGIDNYNDIDVIFTDIDEFVNNKNVVNGLKKKKTSCYTNTIYGISKDFVTMANILDYPIDTKEERQLLVDKMKEISNCYWSTYKELMESRVNRLEQLWVDVAKYFKIMDNWRN